MSQTTATKNLLLFEPQSNRPLVEQVAGHIRSKINHGEIPQGSMLPASSSFDGVSHVTVLKAYQQLEREGLIEIRRSRGSRVISAIPTQRYILITQNADNEATLYENQIVASTYNVACFSDQSAIVHYVPSSKIKTREEAALILAPAIGTLLESNLIRGVIVNHPKNMPGVLDWLNSWKLPVVGLGSKAGNYVISDSRGASIQAINHLQELGCKRIFMYQPPENKTDLRKINKLFPTVKSKTYDKQYRKIGAIHYGKDLAKTLLAMPSAKRPDALILIDDMIMLGLHLEMIQQGFKIPEDMRLLLSTHKCQLLDVFENVDLLTFDTDELIRQAVGMIESIVHTRKQPQSKTVPFDFI